MDKAKKVSFKLSKGQRIVVGYLLCGVTINSLALIGKGLGWW